MTRAEAGEGGTGEAQRLLAHLAAAGYVPVMPPVLQPVESFLELSGEDIRRRIFVTQDVGGAELCLRPEFTIPVCRLHRMRADGQAADYSYCGPVFRLAADEPDEFMQAGIESIGRTDTPAADAEVLGLALEGLALLGRTDPTVRLGDMGLTVALLDGLAVPPTAKRRTLRALAAGRSLDSVTNGAEGNPAEEPHAGLLAAIQGQDPRGVRAFVEDVLAIAGISAVGGRSAGEIAERFLARAGAQANGGAGLNRENRAILDRYRAVSGDPDAAARDLRRLVTDAGVRHDALEAALDLFEERTGFIAARGLPIETFRFQGGFARNLDYYTGFIFEAVQGGGPVLVGGGRYDGLLAHLGSAVPLPAVGCTFWIERATGAPPMSDGLVTDALVTDALVLAVPSKGRLQDNANAFFTRAGLTFAQRAGARDYRAKVVGLPGVEVRYLSASEIASQLASGAAHLGVTGEDLIRETLPDATDQVELLTPLGFGHATVVVAVPQAWIDVRVMADLDEVASGMRVRHGRRLRVATKYVNLTRRFFAETGVADYRIVESLGATEGAPAAGSAEIVVDITTTGATLAANALKVLDDGIILRSEANLVASLKAPWGEGQRAVLRAVLGRISAEERARTTREVRAAMPESGSIDLTVMTQLHEAELPYGPPRGENSEIVLRCPEAAVFDLSDALLKAGARAVSVRRIDYAFAAENPLADRLLARL